MEDLHDFLYSLVISNNIYKTTLDDPLSHTWFISPFAVYRLTVLLLLNCPDITSH